MDSSTVDDGACSLRERVRRMTELGDDGRRKPPPPDLSKYRLPPEELKRYQRVARIVHQLYYS